MRHLAVFLAATAAHLPHPHGPARCASRACEHRVAHRQARERKRAVVAPYRAWLMRVALCESGNEPATDTGNNFFGLYQFDLSTWQSVGGHGLPSKATRLEQSYRAVLLRLRRGTSPWPICG